MQETPANARVSGAWRAATRTPREHHHASAALAPHLDAFVLILLEYQNVAVLVAGTRQALTRNARAEWDEE
jgi:hypothetical protein